jgi:hypothetical protein
MMGDSFESRSRKNEELLDKKARKLEPSTVRALVEYLDNSLKGL